MMPMRVTDRLAGPNAMDSYSATDDEEPLVDHARAASRHTPAALATSQPTKPAAVPEEDIRRYMVPQVRAVLGPLLVGAGMRIAHEFLAESPPGDGA